ncbi:MAG TPA: enoyl-CoA hydratase/isomerase family protein [Burkholderiaceae bacterium]|nr:enoyl-CoA hydratase/isomerase family protein [Burkholderiaceae bacterium]
MPIIYERQNNIGVFTMDNPKVNAFTPLMHKEFHDALQSFLADEQAHVGVLTGAGDRAFCAGDDIKHPWGQGSLKADLDAHFRPSAANRQDRRPGWERETALMERNKPIIAAVNGPALGMGLFYLLTHTDIRIAVPSAFFGFPEIAYGMAGAGGLAQVGRHLPRTVAMSMLLTGEPLSAEDALKFHLINELVEPDELMNRAMEIATVIASHPPLSVKIEMEAFNRGVEMPRRDAIQYSTHLYRLQRATYLLDPDNKALPLADS